MRKFALMLAGVLCALSCSISGAQIAPHQMYFDRSVPVQPGDCLAIQSFRPSLGAVGKDSATPCTPSVITTAYTNATTVYTAIMSLPAVQGATLVRGECTLTYQDSSTSGTVTFAAGLSAAPTDLWATSKATSGAFVAPTFTTITGTTQTAITGALATTTANAPYQLHVSFVLNNATLANTLTIYAASNSTSYSISVLAGSSCAWLP